jgi:RNA polymerase sigma factor (sigma-70 family)
LRPPVLPDDRWRFWLRLLRGGDILVRGQIVEAYFDYVLRALVNISSNLNSKWYSPLPHPRVLELANELTNIAFAEAFAHIEQFDETQSALPTWIVLKGRSRLKGIVLKEIREASRQSATDNDELTQRSLSGQLDDLATDPAEQAVNRVEASEVARRVNEVLQAMSPDHRRALVLAYMQPPPDASAIAAIARDLGKSPVAADSLLRRAARDFRSRWEELKRRDELQ